VKYDFELDLDVENNSHTQLIRRIPTGSSVLELGCATGYMSRYLRDKLKCNVVGVELDPEAAKQAEASCDRVILANVEEDSWIEELGSRQFDVITCADIIEHLRDPDAFLAKIKKLIKPSGFLLVSLPNGAHASLRLELLEGRFTYEDTGLLDRTHLHLFTHQSLRTLFTQAGYKVAELSYTFHDMSDDVIAERLKRVGLEASAQAIAYFHTPEASAYQFIITAHPCEDVDAAIVPELTDKPMKDSLEVYKNLLAELHETREVSGTRAKIIEARDLQLNALQNQFDRLRSEKESLLVRLSNLNDGLNDTNQRLNKATETNVHLTNQIAAKNTVERELRSNLAAHSHALLGIQNSLSWRVYRKLSLPARAVRRALPFLSYLLRNPGQAPSWAKKAWRLWRAGGMSALKYHLSRNGEHAASPINRNYATWIEQVETLKDASPDVVSEFLTASTRLPLISIVMPVYNVQESWLRKAIESVLEQSYPHWELCIVDDASTAVHVRPVLNEYLEIDQRVKVAFRDVNGHISVASNTGVSLASGQYIGFMDHDDLLTKNALYYVAHEIIAHPDARLIYSDEDKIDSNGVRFAHYFKPDFNPDLMLSHNMICHFGVYEKKIIEEVDGFREGFEGAQDYDLALRVIARISTEQIRHIPKILYHWRSIPESTASGGDAKPYALTAAIKAVGDYLSTKGLKAEVSESPFIDGMLRVKYQLPEDPPLVSLIIPTRNGLELLRQCISSIKDRTTYPNYEIIIVDNGSDDRETLEYMSDLEQAGSATVLRYQKPFNYAAINNFAVEKVSGELLGFLNNDIEVINDDWLSEMVSHAVREDVGAVGARLWYPDDSLQHGGVVLGLGGVAGHAMKYLPKTAKGYNARAVLVQNYSAITAACLVVRKDIFNKVGGFDEENLAVAFNDVDLCLRIRESGFRNLWTPFADLYHHESASRGAEDTMEKQARFKNEIDYMINRWGKVLKHDPAYNPNLTANREDFSLRW